jgi:hypothetical protein
MEKNMRSIRPETLSDKELLQAAYILWNDESGMPIAFQKEMMRRCAGLIDKLQFGGLQKPEHETKQLRLFED